MKKFIYTVITVLSIIFTFSVCTPYNSNKVNYEMIQGKWILVDAHHAEKRIDTAFLDFEKEQTILLFEDNKCFQYMPYINDTLTFTFYINDYKLSLYKDSVPVNTFGIIALTQDSLILLNNTTLRKYKKTEQ